jgi:hypothetical protein
VARIYQLHKAAGSLGLLITEGPHEDTQDLQVPVFRWFDRFLKKADPLIEMAAVKLLSPQELKVFQRIPAGERTSSIHETFVPKASRPEISTNVLRERVFAGWPDMAELPKFRLNQPQAGLTEIEFESQPHVTLMLRVRGNLSTAKRVVLIVVHEGAEHAAGEAPGEVAQATLFVRGADPAGNEPRESIQIRRRYMLVGQTLDGMRVWDILRAVDLLHRLPGFQGKTISASARGRHASNLLLAALFDARLARLELPPLAEYSGSADYLNFDRVSSLEAVYRELERAGRVSERPASSGNP